jgi:hypothetical protein
MSRYMKDLKTSLAPDDATRVASDYMRALGFVERTDKGEKVWRKGFGLFAVPQFVKAECEPGMVHIEAWVSGLALLPGIYLGEQGLDGAWAFAIKKTLKSRIVKLEEMLAGQPAAVAPAWYPDPTGRHEQRYWDGARWTGDVSDGGRQSIDDA